MNIKKKLTVFNKEFYGLFFTELWERFSFYGLNALLLFYLYFSVDNGGLGLSKDIAASITFIYASFIYLSSIIGGYIADWILGTYKTSFIGGIIIMFGHIILSLLHGLNGLFVGLILIIFGTGLLKPNISTMIGELYPKDNRLRESAYSLYYLGINLGSFIAPLTAGTIGLLYNFHYGFGIASIGMFIGLIFLYLTNKKSLKSDTNYYKISDKNIKHFTKAFIIVFFTSILIISVPFKLVYITSLIRLISLIICIIPFLFFYMILRSKKITEYEYKNILGYIPLFIAAMTFFAVQDLSLTVFLLFSTTNVNLHGMPVSWLNSINPLFIILFTPIFSYLWFRLDKRSPSSIMKFIYGLFITGLSFLFIIIPLLIQGLNIKIDIMWIVLPTVLMVISELLISPIGLSVTNNMAPKLFKSEMMALWFIGMATENAINSQFIHFFNGNEIHLFIILMLISLFTGIILWFYYQKISKFNYDS